MGKNKKDSVAEVDVNKLVAENDSGGRQPGPKVSLLIVGICLAWSLFQLWIASPLPFALGIGVFNDTQSRALHLAFAVCLAYLAYPALARSPRDRVVNAPAPGRPGRPERPQRRGGSRATACR